MGTNRNKGFEQRVEDRRLHDCRAMEEAMRKLAHAIANSGENDDVGNRARSCSEPDTTQGAAPQSMPSVPGKREWVRRARALAEQCPDLERTDALTWLDQRIERAFAGTGARYRLAELVGPWYKDAAGVMLAVLEGGRPVALVPGAHGYTFDDPVSGKRQRVTGENAVKFGKSAFVFYRPLPNRPLRLSDIVTYLAQGLELRDILLVLGCLTLSTALGMLFPLANAMLFGPVLAAGDAAILPNAAILLINVGIAQAIINGAKALALTGVGNKLALHIQAAAMMRLLDLPASFFRGRSSGELSSLLEGFPKVASSIQQVILGAALSSIFSLVYLWQIFAIAPALAPPAAAVIAANVAITLAVSLAQAKVDRQRIDLHARLAGWQSALLDSIRTIRSNGAETRAFATWASRYAPVARLEYNGPLLARIAQTLQLAVSLLGTVAIYGTAAGAGVSTAEYMAFSSAYGMVLGAFMTLASTAGTAAQIHPQLDALRPILDANPEVSLGRPAPKKVTGQIDLAGVTFGYDPDHPVIKDLALHVKPDDYVAIVGASGCGKSTLMRLILGFETPQAGSVSYDGLRLETLDIQAVRQNIGVVLQDTQLFAGDILSNITISAPWLSEADAWRAAEAAGIADDIRRLPMGMGTVVAAGGAGFSGGQKQRLAIARALAPQPAILMFDEATSALDNKTQQIVCDTLDNLSCTRIVIAHRISTIRNCKRICMLEDGHVAEEGTYDELMTKRGAFYELVKHQEL